MSKPDNKIKIKGKNPKVRLKTRLDSLVVKKGLAASRDRARALIMTGKVLVNDTPMDKPGTRVQADAEIVVKGPDNPYVSRGGLKLERAIKVLSLDIKGLTCLDIGASTGGFTDCLLKFGAGKVYAVDVGYGQMAWSLRQDPRVKVIERTNIRYIDFQAIGETVDLITVDTSFISLKIVVPSAEKFMKKKTRILALIKPQFEAGRQRIGKGGVVRDPLVREEIINEIVDFFNHRGYETGQVIESPVKGPKGNIEFIMSMKYQ